MYNAMVDDTSPYFSFFENHDSIVKITCQASLK